MHIQVDSDTRYNIIRELLGRLRADSEKQKTSRPYSGFKQIALKLKESPNEAEAKQASEDIAFLERLEDLPPYPLKLTPQNVQDITRIYGIMGKKLMSPDTWQYFMEYCEEKNLLPHIEPLDPAVKESLATLLNSMKLKASIIQANGTATEGTVTSKDGPNRKAS